MRLRLRRLHQDESGQVVAFFVCILVLIFGFMALAIDLGFFFHARRVAQNAADPAALAGAAALSNCALADLYDAGCHVPWKQELVHVQIEAPAGGVGKAQGRRPNVLDHLHPRPEVGQQADFQAVLEHDLVGANARARLPVTRTATQRLRRTAS